MNVFLPFIVGFILASLILPVIKWVEKHLPYAGKKPRFAQLKRISIIVVVYLLFLAAVGFIIFYIITVMGKSLVEMAQNFPQLIPDALYMIKKWLVTVPFLSSPEIQGQIDTLALQASEMLGNALKDFVTSDIELSDSSLSMILGFAIMPIFMFFILKDWDKLRDRLYTVIPQWTRTHTKNIFSILYNVVGRYIRGQLLLGLAVGLFAGIMLFILRIEFALPLAVFAGITELVPMIGPWLGGIVGVMVTLAVAPEKTIFVALGFLLIQLLENNLLVPKIQGSQMNIHPAFIIMLTVLGAYFAGIMGFIIVLPLTMAIIEIFKYLRKSTSEGKIN